MSNPPRQKGTKGEGEVARILGDWARRTSAGKAWDVEVPGYHGPGSQCRVLEALATRPDRGQWLITMRLEDFADIFSSWKIDGSGADDELHVEVKRYARFSLHTIFDGKFGQ